MERRTFKVSVNDSTYPDAPVLTKSVSAYGAYDAAQRAVSEYRQGITLNPGTHLPNNWWMFIAVAADGRHVEAFVKSNASRRIKQ